MPPPTSTLQSYRSRYSQADKSKLYATAWTTPPGLAAYSVERDDTGVPTVKLINSVETQARSGYCCNSAVAVYSAGGPTGEVFQLDPTTGGFKSEIQKLDFVDRGVQVDSGVSLQLCAQLEKADS